MATTKAEEIEQTSKEIEKIIVSTEEIIENSVQLMIKSSIGTEAALAELEADYANLIITGINDMAGYKTAKDGIRIIKGKRSILKSTRKELTAPALKYQKDLISAETGIDSRLEALQNSLDAKVTEIDDLKAAASRSLQLQRIQELTENGYNQAGNLLVCGPVNVSVDDLSSLEEEVYDSYLEKGKAEIERKAAEEKRHNDLKEELEEAKRLLAEQREELKHMKDQLDAEKQELSLQKAALEETYGQLADSEMAVEYQKPEQGIQEPAPIAGKNSENGPAGEKAPFVDSSGVEDISLVRKRKMVEIGFTWISTRDTLRLANHSYTVAEIALMTPNEFDNLLETLNPSAEKQPIASQDQTPVVEENSDLKFDEGFNVGIDLFRNRLVLFVTDENNPLSRRILETWAKDFTANSKSPF